MGRNGSYSNDIRMEIVTKYQNVADISINYFSDRFAKRQLINFNSQLTKRKIEICNKLERIRKPVYYLPFIE